MKVCLISKNKINDSGSEVYLSNTDFSIQKIFLEEDNLEQLNNMCADIIIFDVINHKGDKGDISFISKIQEMTKNIPILLVTNNCESSVYRENMLDAGVDGCVQQPFSEEELHLRLKKLLSKKDTLLFLGTKIDTSDVSVDIRNHIVKKSGEKISLTKTEYCILLHLFLHKNLPVASSELARCLHEDVTKDLSAINIHILNLRKKIKNSELIKTIPLYGFTISDAVMLI